MNHEQSHAVRQACNFNNLSQYECQNIFNVEYLQMMIICNNHFHGAKHLNKIQASVYGVPPQEVTLL